MFFQNGRFWDPLQNPMGTTNRPNDTNTSKIEISGLVQKRVPETTLRPRRRPTRFKANFKRKLDMFRALFYICCRRLDTCQYNNLMKKQSAGYPAHHKLSEVALQLHSTHNKSTTKNLQGPPRTNTKQGTQTKIKNTKHDTAFHIISQTAKKTHSTKRHLHKKGGAVSRRMASSIRSGPEGARGVFACRRIVPFLVCHRNTKQCQLN